MFMMSRQGFAQLGNASYPLQKRFYESLQPNLRFDDWIAVPSTFQAEVADFHSSTKSALSSDANHFAHLAERQDIEVCGVGRRRGVAPRVLLLSVDAFWSSGVALLCHVCPLRAFPGGCCSVQALHAFGASRYNAHLRVACVWPCAMVRTGNRPQEGASRLGFHCSFRAGGWRRYFCRWPLSVPSGARVENPQAHNIPRQKHKRAERCAGGIWHSVRAWALNRRSSRSRRTR